MHQTGRIRLTINRIEEMLIKYPGSLSLHVSFSCPVCDGRETFKVTNGSTVCMCFSFYGASLFAFFYPLLLL